MKIKADFKQGDKITEIPAGWFNAVASFVNNLVGVNNIAVKRPHGPVTESSPVEIEFVGEPPIVSNAANPGATVTDLGIKTGAVPYEGTDSVSSAPMNTTWTSGSTNGLKILVVTRVFYDYSATTPVLKAFCRELVLDKNGMVYSASSEMSYEIDTPVEGY